MRAYWGSRGSALLILRLGTRLRWVTNFILLLTAGKTPITYEVGGCVGHRAGLRVFEMVEVSCCTRIRTPNRPARSLFSIPTTLPGGSVREKSNSDVQFSYTHILHPFVLWEYLFSLMDWVLKMNFSFYESPCCKLCFANSTIDLNWLNCIYAKKKKSRRCRFEPKELQEILQNAFPICYIKI